VVLGFSDYQGPIREETEFLIIGSGPGGATLAYRLAAAGRKVTVIEAGPRVTPENMFDDIGRTLASYFWDGGTRSVRGNVFFPTLQARALGGGSVFNSAICMRPLDSALQRWQEEHGLEELTSDELDPHFDAVEAFYNIKPTDEAVMGRRNQLFREACGVLGWQSAPIHRFEEGCRGSGNCILGCRHQAKNSMDRRGIAEVAELGGRVYTSVHVDELIVDRGRVRGVVGAAIDPRTHARGPEVRISAACTILAAGAVGSPAVMRASGFRREAVGSRLLFHPSCYVVGVLEETVNPWVGATQGIHSSEHLERGIKLEALWATASTFSRGFPRQPKQFKRYLKRWPNMAVFDAWISGDASEGQVRTLPGGRPDLTYRLGEADLRRLQEANALLCEMFAAVGAREVITGINGLSEVMDPMEAVREIRANRFGVTDLPTASNHVMGGSPMGSDPERAVCDGWGKVYEADDLYVADTGLFPSSPGVNPQLTAMALAWRLGGELPSRY
jgi:choline dehydrogenase-like flavoprotein